MTSTAKTAITADVSALTDGQSADAADVSAAIDDLLDHAKAGRLSVSANDTHAKHLEDALVITSGKLKLTKQNSGADENLLIDLDATGITSGYVATANGSGSWSWASAAGGGAAPVDLTGTAGEALALRDAVYLASDGQWYKIDADSSPVRCGRVRGFVTAAGGISSGSTGTIRVLGEVSGFSGLTAWGDVWASTTAGSYTQTKPTVTAGGGQKAAVRLGFAVSTTAVMAWPYPVEYFKRESLAGDGTLTIEHHTDAAGRNRKLRAYVSASGGNVAAEYGSANQDVGVNLRGPDGAGGTTTINASGSTSPVGTFTDGYERRCGQSFQVSAGILSQFVVGMGATTGSPTGTVTWEVCADSGGEPGTVLLSGTFTPTASADNTINVADGIFLAASTTYWLVLRSTNTQSTSNYWTWVRSSSSVYASGNVSTWSGASSAWTAATSSDFDVNITTSAVSALDKLAQSFTTASTKTIIDVVLYLRKVGSPTGTMTLRLETDNSGSPSGTLAHANATITVDESGLSTSYANVSFNWTDFSLPAGTYWLVLSTSRSASNTNYVAWGADGSSPAFSGGEMKSEASAAWSAQSKDAIFTVTESGTTYEELCVIGRWAAGSRDIAARFDDGAGADGNTKTTYKNVSGTTLDVTCVVELE